MKEGPRSNEDSGAIADATVVFDLGGVLIDWEPRYLYRQLLPDEAAVEDFLARICPLEWNERQDAGQQSYPIYFSVI